MSGARINWADVVYAALCPVHGLFKGAVKGAAALMGSLALHSEHIGERQAFERDAGRSIESLTREDS